MIIQVRCAVRYHTGMRRERVTIMWDLPFPGWSLRHQTVVTILRHDRWSLTA